MGTHFHLVDHYQKLQSPIHSMDGRVKLIFTLTFILCCSLLPSGAWSAYIILLSILIALTWVADIGLGYVFKRSLLALPFILAAFPLLFKSSGPPLLSFSMGSHTISIYLEGFIRFTSIMIRSWLSVTMAIILASTTSFSDMVLALRAIGVPRLLVAVFSLMWRYLLLMVEEADRLVRARISRSGFVSNSYQRTGGTLAWRAKVTGGMVGSLFIRSIERSERIYTAMLARGYDGDIRSMDEPPLDKWTIIQLAAAIAGLLGLALLTLLLSGAG